MWDVCEFSDEITSGSLEISKFAVELHSILDGTADKSYQDPQTFLDNTYLTDAMEIILKDSLLRLVNNQGKPIDLLDVSFGGGKTHSIVLLYHVFRNRDVGTRFIQDNGFASRYGINEIPDVAVVAIDGRAIKKNTLWGEIADRFGKYEEFRELDEKKSAPKNIAKIKSLFSKPALLMLDEVPQYLMKVRSDDESLMNANLVFLNELSSAVASLDNMRLVITTTAEQSLLMDMADRVKKHTLDAYNVTEKFKEAVSRSADPLVPVKEKDTYGVIRKRLVKKIDESERDKAVDAYYDYYLERNLVPDENYREKMRNAYPFHPFFIETLYNRVGTIQDFNKTRGMFRLLGLVLHYVVKNKIPCTLVDTGSLQLEEQPIMDDLTSKIHRDFQEIIQSDCIDKAARLDGKKNEKVVERIARTIYLYSLIGTSGKMSGIHVSDLKLALGRPGMDVGLVEQALDEVESEFWFVKNANGEFYFDKDPNINKIIDQYKRDVPQDRMRETINESLKLLVPPRSGIKPAIWSPNALDEDDNIRIYVRDYQDPLTDEKSVEKEMTKTLTEKPGGEIRINQNTIVMLYADYNGTDMLQDKARTVAGIMAAENDERIRLERENSKILKTRLDAARGELNRACIQTYSKIAYPRGAYVRLDQISVMDSKNTKSLTDMIVERLVRQGKMMDPSKDFSHDVIRFDEQTKIVSNILDGFRKDKSRHFVLDNTTIYNAVIDGVREGVFGYARTLEEVDGKYRGTIGKAADVSWSGFWSGFLINKDLVLVEDPEPQDDGDDNTSTESTESHPTSISNQFRYGIKTNDIQQTLETIDHLSILSMNNEFAQRLKTEIKLDDTSVSIDTTLQKQEEVKSLLKSLGSKNYTGSGYFTVSSSADLKDNFKERNIEVDSI